MSNSTGESPTSDKPDTAEADGVEGADPDTVSDPAENDSSTDWSSEGGAVTEGPATDPEDDPQDG